MDAKALRLANFMMLAIVLIASPFLLWDFWSSVAKDVPRLGVYGYVTGPMFAHKISEIVIGGAWLWFAFMYNHEKANRWPSWMSPQRYRRTLRIVGMVVLWSTVLATYAWTVLNLGTSARTTDIAEPPGVGEDWLVWRFYLGAVVVGGATYVMLVVRKLTQDQKAP
ncbi:MAG TPA: hypothetical protein VF017_15310 [Thermoanaerobaculia bacterium]|nr:hypothetical protein [Thermoanaerobaculia bacterium]